jgi:hypothetical protein
MEHKKPLLDVSQSPLLRSGNKISEPKPFPLQQSQDSKSTRTQSQNTNNQPDYTSVTKKPTIKNQNKTTEQILSELLEGREFYLNEFRKELPESGKEFREAIWVLLNFINGTMGNVKDEVLVKDEYSMKFRFKCELKEEDFLGKDNKNFVISDIPLDIYLFFNVLVVLSKQKKVCVKFSLDIVEEEKLEKKVIKTGFIMPTITEVPMFKEIEFTIEKYKFMRDFVIIGNEGGIALDITNDVSEN